MLLLNLLQKINILIYNTILPSMCLILRCRRSATVFRYSATNRTKKVVVDCEKNSGIAYSGRRKNSDAHLCLYLKATCTISVIILQNDTLLKDVFLNHKCYIPHTTYCIVQNICDNTVSLLM